MSQQNASNAAAASGNDGGEHRDALHERLTKLSNVADPDGLREAQRVLELCNTDPLMLKIMEERVHNWESDVLHEHGKAETLKAGVSSDDRDNDCYYDDSSRQQQQRQSADAQHDDGGGASRETQRMLDLCRGDPLMLRIMQERLGIVGGEEESQTATAEANAAAAASQTAEQREAERMRELCGGDPLMLRIMQERMQRSESDE